VLYLLPMNGTFERKTITVPASPEVLRIGRQTNAKTIPSPANGYFDSKVLSRQHAEIWADKGGHIWIRDVKSSNGTFVNGTRLSAENRDSEPHELREGDIMELGIDIVNDDGKSVLHHKVAARVEHAGFYAGAPNPAELSFGQLDPMGQGGLMAPPLQQQAGQRGRPGSQGSAGGNGRMGPNQQGNPSNQIQHLGQERQMMNWLQPVKVEFLVAKLKVSYGNRLLRELPC
jgi:FHA domain